MSEATTQSGEARPRLPHPLRPSDDNVTPRRRKPGRGSRVGAIVVLILIVASLTWYFVSDRLTPYTSQARVQAFVVPVAAEVSGKVLKVHVKNNDTVKPGQPLFDIDPVPYQIALQRSRSDYESVRISVTTTNTAVGAARAALQAATAGRVYAQQDATRLEQIFKEDPGAISIRRVESARSSRIKAQSQEVAAQVDLRRAIETAGERGDKNAQLISARSAIEKAELDFKRTQVVAPGGGDGDRPEDRRRPVRAGRRAGDDADRRPRPLDQRRHDREQPRQHQAGRRGGHRARRHAGRGAEGPRAQRRQRREPGSQSQPGTLPTIENSRDWLRQAQRFPVAVEFDPSERERLGAVRIGGQADVLVYTGDHGLMNWLGRVFIGLMSYLSYLY